VVGVKGFEGRLGLGTKSFPGAARSDLAGRPALVSITPSGTISAAGIHHSQATISGGQSLLEEVQELQTHSL